MGRRSVAASPCASTPTRWIVLRGPEASSRLRQAVHLDELAHRGSAGLEAGADLAPPSSRNASRRVSARRRVPRPPPGLDGRASAARCERGETVDFRRRDVRASRPVGGAAPRLRRDRLHAGSCGNRASSSSSPHRAPGVKASGSPMRGWCSTPKDRRFRGGAAGAAAGAGAGPFLSDFRDLKVGDSSSTPTTASAASSGWSSIDVGSESASSWSSSTPAATSCSCPSSA